MVCCSIVLAIQTSTDREPSVLFLNVCSKESERGCKLRQRAGMSPTYPESYCLHIAVIGHLNCPLEADELGSAESVEDLLGGGSLVRDVVEAVGDQVLHVRPRGTAVLLQSLDGPALARRRGKRRKESVITCMYGFLRNNIQLS